MKRFKALTREQKEIASEHYLSPDSWLLEREMEFYLKLRHKTTGRIRFIDKFRRKRK